jgi:hypothetical protein
MVNNLGRKKRTAKNLFHDLSVLLFKPAVDNDVAVGAWLCRSNAGALATAELPPLADLRRLRGERRGAGWTDEGNSGTMFLHREFLSLCRSRGADTPPAISILPDWNDVIQSRIS